MINRPATPTWNWRKTSLLLQTLSAVAAISATAGTVRITAINDAYDPNHSRVMEVRPGDVINLSSDILDENNNYNPTYTPVERFTWYANDRRGDACDASVTSDCLTSSNFQVSNYGVSFYVPYNMGSEILVSVYSNDPSARNNEGQITYDTLVLRNALDQNGDYQPPTQIVTSAADYSYGTLNADYALAGQGRWVWISGTRYWVPYTYMSHNDSDWTPYRNGYWTYDSVYGYTWISYDPWGWMTDHYGVWRYHGVYGWTWLPFEDYTYHPHCATFFYDGDYIGWYPYYNGYANGYRHGYDDGFRDGFWAGYDAANGYGTPGYNYHPGFSVVHYNNFGHGNIVEVYNSNVITREHISAIQNGAHNGTFGGMPGRATTIEQSRVFMSGRGVTVAETRTEITGSGSGRVVMSARPTNAVPPEYKSIAGNGSLNRNTPVGSVVDTRNVEQGGRTSIIAPTSNGRGVVQAPRTIDQSGATHEMPSQSTRPAAINEQSPVATRGIPTQQAGQPSQSRPAGPVYNPSAPPSRDPIRSNPVPTRPTQPSQPSEPSRPSQPSQPSRPSQPSEPSRPSQPSEPSRPSQPSQPQPPRQEPSQPQPPSRPTWPTQPSQPQPPRQEPSQPQPPRQQPSQPQPPRQEPSQPQPPRQQPSQPQPPRQEPSRPSEPPSRPSQPSQPSGPSRGPSGPGRR